MKKCFFSKILVTLVLFFGLTSLVNAASCYVLDINVQELSEYSQENQIIGEQFLEKVKQKNLHSETALKKMLSAIVEKKALAESGPKSLRGYNWDERSKKIDAVVAALYEEYKKLCDEKKAPVEVEIMCPQYAPAIIQIGCYQAKSTTNKSGCTVPGKVICIQNEKSFKLLLDHTNKKVCDNLESSAASKTGSTNMINLDMSQHVQDCGKYYKIGAPASLPDATDTLYSKKDVRKTITCGGYRPDNFVQPSECSVTCKSVGIKLCIAPKKAVCGNFTVEKGEQCDDGNAIAGDGCNNLCQVENNICTKEYAPVCGQPKGGGCFKNSSGITICVDQAMEKTYGNKCELEKAGASFLYKGKCNGGAVCGMAIIPELSEDDRKKGCKYIEKKGNYGCNSYERVCTIKQCGIPIMPLLSEDDRKKGCKYVYKPGTNACGTYEKVCKIDHTMCTREVDPVCGQPAGGGCKTDENGMTICVDPAMEKTYGNKCELEKAGASFLYKGKCNGGAVCGMAIIPELSEDDRKKGCKYIEKKGNYGCNSYERVCTIKQCGIPIMPLLSEDDRKKGCKYVYKPGTNACGTYEKVCKIDHTMCTREVDPVCGQPAGGGCKTDENGMTVCVDPAMEQTYPNKCELDKAEATFLYNGKCGSIVKEPVVCAMSGDIDLNKKVNKDDAKALLDVLLKDRAKNICTDVNKDEKINILDMYELINILKK